MPLAALINISPFLRVTGKKAATRGDFWHGLIFDFTLQGKFTATPCRTPVPHTHTHTRTAAVQASAGVTTTGSDRPEETDASGMGSRTCNARRFKTQHAEKRIIPANCAQLRKLINKDVI